MSNCDSDCSSVNHGSGLASPPEFRSMWYKFLARCPKLPLTVNCWIMIYLRGKYNIIRQKTLPRQNAKPHKRWLFDKCCFAEAKRKASQALVIRQVLLDKVQPAIDAGVDEETAIANLIDENIPAIVVTEAECERFYRRNTALFQTPPLMVVRHILLAVDKDDLQGRAEQKKLADKLLSDLHRARFIRRNSSGTNRARI